MADFSKFNGVLPYDSELLGVFQPLLGWRGRSGHVLRRRALAERVSLLAARSMASAPVAGAISSGPVRASVGNPVLDALVAHVAGVYPGQTELTDDQWRAVLTPDVVEFAVQAAASALPRADVATLAAGPGGIAGDASATLGAYYHATGAVVQSWLSQAPSAFNGLLVGTAPLQTLPAYGDQFPTLADVVLSPIGILHLFRQYFFELDSMLGPPVGHVWLSPGSTVELVESTVRRRLEERTIEATLEVTQKSESTVETKDELSEAVKQDNADDMTIAASASGGFSVGVAHGEASASFNLNQARKTAAEQTHKRTRSQTERKSTEIRQSYKTTFRTVSEVTDTTSKRYVLQNTTENLVNYELRRKMRRVAVQLQHIGTQLCWQYYVDAPGSGLRISRLVHLAKLSDADVGLHPPESTTLPDGYDDEFVATLMFQPLDYSAQTYWDEDWVTGASGNKHIQWEWDATQPPKQGFQLIDASYGELLPQGDLGGAPALYVNPVVKVTSQANGTVHISLPQINFHSAHGIKVRIKLRYGPSQNTIDEANKQFEAAQKNFQEERARAYQDAFVSAVRDRIKAAGEVRTRPFDDLREEERHSIFRRLVDALTLGGTATADKHISAEVVRQFFDVDAILYFIAPDWWDPSARHHAFLNVATPQQNPVAQGTLELHPTDQVDWGTNWSTVGDPYLVTEESRPAPMGASIGWVLQLDGDRMRNAFLNAAWAKVVVPIRPGREHEAMAWLRDQAEQEVGLNEEYQLQPDDPQEWSGKTLAEVLEILIGRIQTEHAQASTVDPKVDALPGERVFEKGFDPMAGGVKFDADALTVYDQWVDVLPTDQVVAVAYPPQA